VIPGFSVEVEGGGPSKIAVSDDGSRIYFTTKKRLLPGAPGTAAVYRVDVASGNLAYVAATGGEVGTDNVSVELTPDGGALAFSADRASLNPLGDTTDNGGTTQYYRYDDADRSLICASCPQDGSPPFANVESGILAGPTGQPNKHALSADGDTLAFTTPTPLVGADQNTPEPGHLPETGGDIYEWRDGRPILITDGLTNWSENASQGAALSPSVQGITPSGSDIYFTATAAYTPDAPDALLRLYDARIGGGIDFPPPPPPCPLEVCQGTPKGAPEEQEPASRNFSGLGNVSKPTTARCPKGKRRVRQGGKPRCVKARKPRHHRAAKHNRRTHR
jgi:dipeptidyl aminopeptidase/acylaminoacyl peptidase